MKRSTSRPCSANLAPPCSVSSLALCEIVVNNDSCSVLTVADSIVMLRSLMQTLSAAKRRVGPGIVCGQRRLRQKLFMP